MRSIRLLLKILSILGISVFHTSESGSFVSKILQFAYPFYVHGSLIIIILIFANHIYHTTKTVKTNVAHMSICVLSVVLWHIVYGKRKYLKSIFKGLTEMSEKLKTNKYQTFIIVKILLLVNMAVTVVCALIYVIGLNDGNSSCVVFSLYKWKSCQKTFFGRMYIFLVSLSIHVLSSSFTNLISLFYCVLCYQCSYLLKEFRKTFKKKINRTTYYIPLTKLATEYFDLYQIIYKIQSTLSLPSLLILTICFMKGFISLSRIMINPTQELRLFFLIQHTCLHIPTGMFCFAVPAFAAHVTLQMASNKALFRQILNKILIYPEKEQNFRNLRILKTLKRMPPITFSAWDMVEFSGTTIPSVFGTFLVYSLLVLSINIK